MKKISIQKISMMKKILFGLALFGELFGGIFLAPGSLQLAHAHWQYLGLAARQWALDRKIIERIAAGKKIAALCCSLLSAEPIVAAPGLPASGLALPKLPWCATRTASSSSK